MNNYSYYNTELSQDEIDENIGHQYKKIIGNDINNTLNNNIISIKRKNNFIQRNKSVNCLLKLQKIIGKNNLPNHKNNKTKSNKLNRNNNRFSYNKKNNNLNYQIMYKNN